MKAPRHCRYSHPVALLRLAFFALTVLLGSSFCLRAIASLPGQNEGPKTTEVTGETGTFSVTLEALAPVEGVSRYQVRFPSPVNSSYEPNNTVVGELYLPGEAGILADPVIILHILNGNFELERLFALQLARAGSPAFWFKLPFYGERRPSGISSSRPVTAEQLLQLLDQGAEDYRRSCDVMALFGKSDDPDIGVVGISMGGILAYHFASLEPRTGRLCSVMAGGDLWGIIQHARETRGMRQAIDQLDAEARRSFQDKLESRDPLQAAQVLQAKAKAGHVLMINASEDEVIPRAHAELLADALGIREEIVWMEDVGHYSIGARLHEVINSMVYFFTGHHPDLEMPELPEGAMVADEWEADVVLTRFLGELGVLLSPMTLSREGQAVQVVFRWEGDNQKPISGQLRWDRRGPGEFALQASSNTWGMLALGQSGRPWLYWGDTLLKGNEEVTDVSLFRKGGSGLLLKLQLLSNLLQYGVRVPGLLEESGQLSSTQNGTILKVDYYLRRQRVLISLEYDSEKGRYERLVIKTAQGLLTLDIEEMATRMGSPVSPLAPPEARQVLNVGSANLQHTLALLLEVIDDKATLWK